MCKVVYRLVILAGLGALPGLRAAEVPAVTPKPIPLLAWSLAELSRDRPWMPSPYPHITGFFWLTQGNVKDPGAARRLIDQQPAGRRVIFDWDVYRSAYQHPADKLTTAAGETFTGPWWDHGLADVEATYDALPPSAIPTPSWSGTPSAGRRSRIPPACARTRIWCCSTTWRSR